MNSYVIFSLLISLIVFIFIYRQVDYIFRESDYLIVLKFCTFSLYINIMIFFYLTATFKNMDTKPGPQGPRGNRGEQGKKGLEDYCKTCDTQENSVGYEFLQDKIENQVIIEKPLLDPRAAQKDPWKDVLGKRVRIFTKKGNAVCGLQWQRRIAGISIIKSNQKAAILDCKGNADLFIINREGTKYYIKSMLGEAKEEKGIHKKIKKGEMKCGMSMTKKAGGTPFTRGTEHTGIFDCSKPKPVYIRGTPKSFKIILVNDNEFTCEAVSSEPAGQLYDVESYERLLKFNCVEQGEDFYIEVV